jgi:hypothetical protein
MRKAYYPYYIISENNVQHEIHLPAHLTLKEGYDLCEKWAWENKIEFIDARNWPQKGYKTIKTGVIYEYYFETD